MPPKTDHHLDLTVVVSGQPTPVRINPQERLDNLVREALHATGNAGQEPSAWELRREGGDLLDQSQRAADVGLADGMTLYLNPGAGAGG